MGVDLTLLPFDADFYSHTMLQVERRRELWPKVTALDSAPLALVSKDFHCYLARDRNGETRYGTLPREDPYGTPYRCTTAGALSKLWTDPEVRDNVRNRAIWDYLAALPPDTRVVLHWH